MTGNNNPENISFKSHHDIGPEDPKINWGPLLTKSNLHTRSNHSNLFLVSDPDLEGMA